MLIKSAGGIALGGGLSGWAGMLNMGRQAVTAATTAMAPLITSVWGFTAALLANPVTWVVIAMIALIAVLVLLYNKCEWFRDGVNAVWDSILSGGRAVVDFFGGLFRHYRSGISAVLGAAEATVNEKLGNMRAAYEAHGGGITGIAAAAMEGIKGFYTAGFTFVDNLTGGKLSAIAGKFTGGINNIKNTVTGAVSWFKQSGAKIMDTSRKGSSSDQQTGGGSERRAAEDPQYAPLLVVEDHHCPHLPCRRRTMSTYAEGIKLAQDLPGQAADAALSNVRSQMSSEGIETTREPVRTLPRDTARTEKENVVEEKTEDRA